MGAAIFFLVLHYYWMISLPDSAQRYSSKRHIPSFFRTTTTSNAKKGKYYHRTTQAAQEHADWQNAVFNYPISFSNNNTFRFLIFSEALTGMGNRLEAAISAYLYAMVTKRIFVMRTNKYHSVIDFYLDPIDETDPRVQRMFHQQLADEKEHKVTIDESALICDDITSTDHVLMQHRKLVLEGNMYFGNLLFYNPHLRLWLQQRFGPRKLNDNNPFRPLFHWFVRLKPAVQQMVDEVKQREIYSHSVIIGLQMRMSESYANLSQMETFWECAVNQAAKEVTKDTKPVRYFLSTDNLLVQEGAQKRFGNDIFWRSNLTKLISLGTNRDLAGALADVVLLSECDGLVVTQASSFGRLAYASSLSGQRPWFVTIDSKIWNRRNYEPNTCRRALTSKPCSDRIYQLLLRKKTGYCVSQSDKEEAYQECDMS